MRIVFLEMQLLMCFTNSRLKRDNYNVKLWVNSYNSTSYQSPTMGIQRKMVRKNIKQTTNVIKTKTNVSPRPTNCSEQK